MQEQLQIGSQTYTNGQMATTALNNLIVSVINNTPPDPERGGLKDYCDILVLGYGDQVNLLLGDSRGMPLSIRDLAARPKGRKQVLTQRFDRALNRYVQVPEEQPYWIDYIANSSRTEMARALQQATQAVQEWLRMDANRQKSFPPIVLNITDGAHNGSGNPSEAADRLRQLYTNDGHVLLFSCHLTSSSGSHQGLAFPRTAQQIDTKVADIDERVWAKHLFAMSSQIPLTMSRKARTAFKVDLQDDARGFIYNASPAELIGFLRWGTQPSENLGRSSFG
jgi:hypothetical protein